MKLPPPSKSDKRMLLVTGGIFLATCVLVGLALITRGRSSPLGDLGTINVGGLGTPLPAPIVEQLTQLPNAPMLTGALADDIRAVEQMVADCPDYSPERRSQMNTHINWVLAPATLPRDMIIALGGNTNGRLIFGMGSFTMSEWGARQKAPDSCLLPIGKKLNELLAANGEERFPAFDSAG